MVFVGRRREEEEEAIEGPEKKSSSMATGTERPRTLHNFSLPCLKWGSQRQLRCVKVEGDAAAGDHFPPVVDRRSPPSSSKSYNHDFTRSSRESLGPERRRRSFFDPDGGARRSSPSRIHRPTPPPTDVGRKKSPRNPASEDDGIEAMRKKLMHDLQTEVDRIKFSVLNRKNVDMDPPPPQPLLPARSEEPLTVPVEEARPWNLRARTRRALGKEPKGYGGGGGSKDLNTDDRRPYFPTSTSSLKCPTRRSDDIGYGGGGCAGEMKPRAKFSVALSKQEIEEDFIAIMGTKPPRRPKKRPRTIQRQMDFLSPGSFLTEITADMYKVNENPEAGKKKRRNEGLTMDD